MLYYNTNIRKIIKTWRWNCIIISYGEKWSFFVTDSRCFENVYCGIVVSMDWSRLSFEVNYVYLAKLHEGKTNVEDALNMWTYGWCSRREYIRASVRLYRSVTFTVWIFLCNWQLAAFFTMRKIRSPSRKSLTGRIDFKLQPIRLSRNCAAYSLSSWHVFSEREVAISPGPISLNFGGIAVFPLGLTYFLQVFSRCRSGWPLGVLEFTTLRGNAIVAEFLKTIIVNVWSYAL